jgi:hypothetical protein
LEIIPYNAIFIFPSFSPQTCNEREEKIARATKGMGLSFSKGILGDGAGYAPLSDGAPDDQEYQRLKKRAIAVIKGLPDDYLSRERREAAVEAVRTGVEPADATLFRDVWDAVTAYQRFIKTGKAKTE